VRLPTFDNYQLLQQANPNTLKILPHSLLLEMRSIFVIFQLFAIIILQVQSLIPKKFFAFSTRVFTVQAVDGLSNLEVFGEITKDIGQLGPIIPLSIAAYVLRQQERKFEDDIKKTNELLSQQIKSSNDLLSKDIKATNDFIKSSNELLSKDLKATNDFIKSSNELLSKDLKATNDFIKSSNELLSKDLKATNEALSKDISRLENLVEKLLESRRV
jgi:hypothetical protein